MQSRLKYLGRNFTFTSFRIQSSKSIVWSKPIQYLGENIIILIDFFAWNAWMLLEDFQNWKNVVARNVVVDSEEISYSAGQL